MSTIFSRTFESTLEQLVSRALSGQKIEAWTFDDAKSRREAQRRLAQKGVSARLRSAYKPLLFAFLEEIDLRGVEAIEIGYPRHPQAAGNRFLLEAYPLAALVGDARLAFVPRDDASFVYQVRLERQGSTETLEVLAPNRIHLDSVGETQVSPTGWLRIDGEAAGQRLETDYEQLFEAAVGAVVGHDWGAEAPYFEELNIGVAHPAEDLALAVGDEVVSLREALHEELYFSLLEHFQRRSGRALGDRTLRPGQIVPEVIKSSGEISVRIITKALSTGFMDGQEQALDSAVEPLAAAQIARQLDALGGTPFSAQSRAGRRVSARYLAGREAAVMISAGQHANETSGIVGALRAAGRLAQRPHAHFTLAALENPDGYALHQRLRVDNPRHMHHAARYTALGDDLEYRSIDGAGVELNEQQIRHRAEAISGARLHLNLHGYPSHEWTRPLCGYVPRGFAMWTLPKGFFLIMRHHPAWRAPAEALLDYVTRRLAAVPGLLEFNRRQAALYRIHAGESGFRLINGFPCWAAADERHRVPVTLITEYPDETIYGAAFIAAHSAQMETVIAAYEGWQLLQSSD